MSEDLLSVLAFSLIPKTLGTEECPGPEPTDFLGGALLGVSHAVIKSSGFPGRSPWSWEKQVFSLPTYLSLHKRKPPRVLAARAGALGKSVLTMALKYLQRNSDERQLLLRKESV